MRVDASVKNSSADVWSEWLTLGPLSVIKMPLKEKGQAATHGSPVRLSRARLSAVSLGRYLESAAFTIDIPGRQRPDWSRVPSDESSNANWPESWFDRAVICIATSQAAVSQPLPRHGAACSAPLLREHLGAD